MASYSKIQALLTAAGCAAALLGAMHGAARAGEREPDAGGESDEAVDEPEDRRSAPEDEVVVTLSHPLI